MYKWIFIGLAIMGLVLYFTGALEIVNSDERVSVTVDKDKAKEFGSSIKQKIKE